ncbi:DUF3772 domain-containing protein [Actibacterium sp.]|uniref:DUF3772 domain-containing protein n=1 Tax=Actibacterium sp. TaxID=1872125 RepID=UPI003565883A
MAGRDAADPAGSLRTVTRAGVLHALALCLALVAGAGGLIAPPPALAQTVAVVDTAKQTVPTTDGVTPDYADWEKTAARAEEAIVAARASTVAFEQLRAELVEWRAALLAAQDQNQTRIATLRDQIAALGPLPVEGEVEPAEIAARRVELNDQLAKLQAPVLKAEEAYRRADGLIREIDTLIRARQADALLQLGPSPLNPVHWAEGLSALSGTVSVVMRETSESWSRATDRAVLQQNLPKVLFYLVVAAVLLVQGRFWMERLTLYLVQGTSRRGRAVYAAVTSLGQILLPYVGLLALMQALYFTGMIGWRTERLTSLVPLLGLYLFGAMWLGGRVFPKVSTKTPMFRLTPERNRQARLITAGLGLVVALGRLLDRMAEVDSYSPEAVAALGFPLLLLAGLLILQMGRTLMIHVHAAAETAEGRYRNSIVRIIARAAMVLAIVGPGLAAVGYTEAANFFTYPAITSLAVLALQAVLQRFVEDVYALVTGDADSAADALIPVLIGFALSLLSLPLLALTWGARETDLTELWTRFTEGFQLGDTRISPSDFLTFVLIFGAGYTATRLMQGGLRASVLPKTKIDPGGQNALVAGLGYLGIFLSALAAITSAGIDLSSLAIVAGALSVGIGFGLQNIVSNFVSGIILLIERPVSEGDWIEVGGVMGTVRDISVRSTRIETFDRTDVIVPNADLVSGMVTNWTRSSLTGRIILKVGVAYGTDTRRVQAILEEIASAHPIAILNPPPLVTFVGFGADSLDFEARVVLSDVTLGLKVQSELNHQIAERFAAEGIEIPFAQRDLWIRNPEALRGVAPTPKPAATPPAPTKVVSTDPNAPREIGDSDSDIR